MERQRAGKGGTDWVDRVERALIHAVQFTKGKWSCVSDADSKSDGLGARHSRALGQMRVSYRDPLRCPRGLNAVASMWAVSLSMRNRGQMHVSVPVLILPIRDAKLGFDLSMPTKKEDVKTVLDHPHLASRRCDRVLCAFTSSSSYLDELSPWQANGWTLAPDAYHDFLHVGQAIQTANRSHNPLLDFYDRSTDPPPRLDLYIDPALATDRVLLPLGILAPPNSAFSPFQCVENKDTFGRPSIQMVYTDHYIGLSSPSVAPWASFVLSGPATMFANDQQRSITVHTPLLNHRDVLVGGAFQIAKQNLTFFLLVALPAVFEIIRTDQDKKEWLTQLGNDLDGVAWPARVTATLIRRHVRDILHKRDPVQPLQMCIVYLPMSGEESDNE
jgi:hypothetical protein